MDYLQDLKKGLYTDEEIQYKIKNNYRLTLEELKYNEEDKSEVANIKNWLRYRILSQIKKGATHDCDRSPIVHEMYNKIFETVGNEKGEGRYFEIDNVTLETDTMNSFATTFNKFMRVWINNGARFNYKTTLSRDIDFLKFIDKWYARTEDEEIKEVSNELDEKSIRGNITIISQNPYIFNFSIRENLLLAKRDATDEELFLRAYDVLVNKFGEDGYAKFYFKDTQYENFLKDLRDLLKDKKKYVDTQREFIKKLKKDNKLK